MPKETKLYCAYDVEYLPELREAILTRARNAKNANTIVVSNQPKPINLKKAKKRKNSKSPEEDRKPKKVKKTKKAKKTKKS